MEEGGTMEVIISQSPYMEYNHHSQAGREGRIRIRWGEPGAGQWPGRMVRWCAGHHGAPDKDHQTPHKVSQISQQSDKG